MPFSKIRTTWLMLALVASTAYSCTVAATENLDPYLLGASTGVPAGALPPPGFYLVNTIYTAHGDTLKSSNGNGVPLKVRNNVNSTILIWVPGWHFLGAEYAAGVIALYAEHNVDTTALGGHATRSPGFFNPVVMPLSLSWDLGQGLHTSTSVNVYVPGGNYHYENGKTLQTSYANNYWTLEPSWAISYLHHGWDFTLNNVFDINRRNPSTDYRSGNAYYLDATVAKTIGRWTVGVIGNYSRQFSDDRQGGEVVGDGNRFQHTLAGPMVAYDFGPARLMLRYLQDVRTRNDVNVSFALATVSFRL